LKHGKKVSFLPNDNSELNTHPFSPIPPAFLLRLGNTLLTAE